MTTLYTNSDRKTSLYIDRMDEMMTLALDEMITQRINMYAPGWIDSWLDRPSDGILIASETVNMRFAQHSTIVHVARQVMADAGLDVNVNDNEISGTIDFWRYSGESTAVAGWNITCANDNHSEDRTCHKCIFVTRRDDDAVNGGHVRIFPDWNEEWLISWFVSPKTFPVPMTTGNVLVLDGNLYHDVSTCLGTGEYHLIMVTLDN